MPDKRVSAVSTCCIHPEYALLEAAHVSRAAHARAYVQSCYTRHLSELHRSGTVHSKHSTLVLRIATAPHRTAQWGEHVNS